MSDVREGGTNNATCLELASDSLDLDLGKTHDHEARIDRLPGTRASNIDICVSFKQPRLRIPP